MTELTSFKDTPLGPLPEEWELIKLSDLAEVKYGKANPRSTGIVPVVGSGGVFAWTNEPLVSYPTLVIGRKGTAGKVWLLEQPSYPSDTAFYLEWKQEVDIRYLFGYLTFNPLSGEHAKTTVPSLSRPDLENCLIPFPPFAEQRAIAHILSTVRQSIEASERVIAATRELKRSMMKHLFTYGAVPVDQAERVRLKETEVGEVPEGWEMLHLNELADIQYGYQTSIPKTPPPNGIEIISTAEIKNQGYLDLHKIRTVEIPHHLIERYSIKQNDLLFNWRNSQEHVGKTALVEFVPQRPLIYASFILRIRPSLALNHRYLHHLLTHLRAEGLFFTLSRRAVNQANYNANELGNLKIPVPLVSEQMAIYSQLDAVDVKIHAEEQRKAALETLFQSLLTQLMTGKVRVSTLIPGPSPFQGEGSAPLSPAGRGSG